MAKETLSDIAIGLSLDTEDFLQGIESSLQKVQKVGENIRSSLGTAQSALSSEGAAATAAAAEVGEAVKAVGSKSQEAAKEAASGFGKLPDLFTTIRGKIMAVTGSLTGAFAAAKLFDTYISQGKGLSDLSRRIGMSVETIDAWGKANEAAGGTAEALQESLASFYQKTGRPATEFLRLGEKIEGMSRLQAQRFLEAQGVALDAIPIFLNGQKAADDLVAKYRRTAFTTQDAKNAQAFKTAWLDFKVAAQDVGNVFLRTVVPVLTRLMDLLASGVSTVRENIRFFTILGGLLASIFAARTAGNISRVVGEIKGFASIAAVAFKPLIIGATLITALALAIEDLIVFVRRGDSAIEGFLKKLGFSDSFIEDIRSSLAAVGEAFGKLWEAAKPLLGDALKAALKGVAFVLSAISLAIGVIVVAITGLIDGIGDVIDWFRDLDQKAKAWLDDLSATCKGLGAEISDWFSGIPDALLSAFSGATDAVAEFFSSWFDLFVEKVVGPIKNGWKSITSSLGFGDDEGSGGESKGAWAGIKDFFGFGDDSDKDSAPSAKPAQQVVVVTQAKYAPPSITSSSNLYMTNNISTRDDPAAIGSSVGRFAYAGAQRSNDSFYQAMRGVRLK